MSPTDKRLLQWLRDSRAIEKRATKMLEQVTRHIANYQEVKSQAEQLIQETHAQADALQGFMGRRSKDAVSAPQKPANPTDGQCLSGAFLGSEAVKEAMTEISSYNILITAAESAGDSETRAVCETIRNQEEAMVEWLRRFLGSATQAHVVGGLAASKRPRRSTGGKPGGPR